MPLLLSIFVTILILCLIFSLAYWMVTLLGNVLPAPVRQPATNVMLCMLALLAIGCLLDVIGVFGDRHMLLHLGRY